jgi:hypothetical protein
VSFTDTTSACRTAIAVRQGGKEAERGKPNLYFISVMSSKSHGRKNNISPPRTVLLFDNLLNVTRDFAGVTRVQIIAFLGGALNNIVRQQAD